MQKAGIYLVQIFCQVLRKHGFRPTEKELHTMIKNVDNHEGGIDFDEFIELLVNHGRNLDDDIAKSFRMFDIDGDGLITEEELQVNSYEFCRAH